MKNEIMKRWEIERILDQLPPQEHEKFVKKIIKDLKKLKLKNDVSKIAKQSWRALGPVALIGALGSSLAAACSGAPMDTLDILSGVGLIGSLTGFAAFTLGSIFEDETGITICEETSQKAKEQIQYLKDKMNSNNLNEFRKA